MKTKKIIYFALMFLPLLIAIVALPFLPEKIPAHYNFAGEIDRWGSKFEMLIFPAVTIAMGFFMLFMAKVAAKDENGKTNEKIVFYTGMGISLWFTAMHVISIYKAFSAAGSLGFSANVDINSLFCVLMGTGLAITGLFMPKLRKNSLIGLRTSWSMKNEITWEKSQRFGGISFMVCGALMIVAGLFLEELAAMFVALGLLVADTIICVIYSYKIAKKY